MNDTERIARYRRAVARLGDRIAALEQPPDPGTWSFWVEAGGSRTGAQTFEAALDYLDKVKPEEGRITDAGGRVVMAYERRRQDDEPSGRAGTVVSGAGAGPATGGPAGYPGETPEVCAGRIPDAPESVPPYQKEEMRVSNEASKATNEAGQPGNGIG
jgi:hypothetical protein